jgi:hypothetical protein
MWSIASWAVSSHERALANARSAATDCGRRRVERDEVAQFLAGHRAGQPAGLGRGDDPHTAGTAVEHPA